MTTTPALSPDTDWLAPAELEAIGLALGDAYTRLENLAELVHDRTLGRGSGRPIDEADVGRVFLACHSAKSNCIGITQEATDTLDWLREALERDREAPAPPEYRRALSTLADQAATK